VKDKKLIVITGATASGKTAVSVALAKQLDCEIINCDSRQVYKEMSIGTAKPTLEEQDNVVHHFVNSHSIKKPITVGDFEKIADKQIAKSFKTNDFVIMVGGSGQFIDAVLHGIDPLPFSQELRDELNNDCKTDGLPSLATRLYALDPEASKTIDLKNPQRVIRALEINLLTNMNLSEVYTKNKKELKYEATIFEVSVPRAALYERIDARVLSMIENGLENEVRSLVKDKDNVALKTVGYREFFDYFENKIDLKTCIELIQQNSRNYAKRQMTWLKRYDETIKLDGMDAVQMANKIVKTITKDAK
jgi:tRNA dimethylallyltransferase